MRLHRTRRAEFAPLIFFPLLNVALLLVPFIVLGSSFVLHPGVSLSLPQSSFLLAPQTQSVFVSIAGGGVPRIYVDDRLSSQKQLGSDLDRFDPEEVGLVIRADRSVRFEVVFAVADVAMSKGFSVVLAAAQQGE